MSWLLDRIPLPPAVPFSVTSYIVAPGAALFFGLDPSRLMSLKERRRYRKNVTRTRREVRVFNRLVRGRHDRCMRDVAQAPL